MAGRKAQPGPDEADAELALWLDHVDQSMGFRAASALGMSCGTVTMDLGRAKVLVVWNSRLKLYQLPKGRRNIEEGMLEAALRETYEETGLRVRPLRLDVATRATPVRKTAPTRKTNGSGGGGDGRNPNPDVTVGHPSTEFIGACLYPDPQSATEALKIVYFFAATADSTATPDVGTQEDWEKLDAKWIPLADVRSTLRFAAEIATVMRAVEDVKRSGYKIGP